MAARRVPSRGVGSLALALTICGLLPAGSALAISRPVTLTVLAPISPSEFPLIIGRFLNTPTETSGGWPITFQLTFDDRQLLGIATEFTPPTFPLTGTRGYAVFNVGADPCLSFLPISYTNEDHPCTDVDETYVEFTPNVLLPGVPNSKGNPAQLFRLTDAGGGGQPRIEIGYPVSLVPYGPATGGAETTVNLCLPESHVFPGDLSSATDCTSDPVCPTPYPRSRTCQTVGSPLDGYGYGASASLPGLVLVADAGPSVMLEQDPTLNQAGDCLLRDAQGHRQARNLAGFLNAVSWELNNSIKTTSILAHVNVPDGLFDPLVVEDPCVGAPYNPGDPGNGVPQSGCEQPVQYRIDGGPVTTTPPDPNRVITARLFIVNQTAPDTLSDWNNDGVVDSKDAAMAGYTVLSNEVRVRFKLLNQSEFPYLLVDLDGNHSFPPVALPAGGGGLTQVPR